MVRYFIILAFLPFIIKSLINIKKPELLQPKPFYGITYGILFILSLYLQIHYYRVFQFHFFPTLFESMLAFIVIGSVVGVMILINLFVTFLQPNMPKQYHNPKLVWKITFLFGFGMATILFWILPLAKKYEFTTMLTQAEETFTTEQVDWELLVIFIKSEQDCIGNRSNNYCENAKYDNFFYVKNNTTDRLKGQVLLRAYDKNKKLMTEIESLVFELDAGTYSLLAFEEEHVDDRTSIWNQLSFQSEEKVVYYEYKVRHEGEE